MNEKLYWLGFSVFPGVGAKKFSGLLKIFRSAENAWKAKSIDLEKVLGKTLAEKFSLFRKSFNLELYAENLKRKNIKIVTLLDEEYPELLKSIIPKEISNTTNVHPPAGGPISNENPPFLLYIKGNVSLLNSNKIIAIVGTRKITRYGEEVTRLLTSQLVQNGFTVVSGLAFGVDSTAHMTTAEDGGNTIAVLGCGVDCCTPSSNQFIYDKILDSGGTIVSALPPEIQATKGSFPARNTIIAGLSLGVLVTEGAEDSGALITAQRSKEFGRPIFGVPGPITSKYSEGVNRLLSRGAIAVTGARDILKTLKLEVRGRNVDNELGSEKEKKSHLLHQNPASHLQPLISNNEEQKILDMLQLGSMHFDEIVRKMNKDTKSVGSLLSMMEIKGIILNSGGVYSL